MKIIQNCLILLGFTLLTITNVFATQTVIPDYQRNRFDYKVIRSSVAGLVELKGEITKIGPAEILVNTTKGVNRIYRIKLTPETKIFCNGAFSQWEALIPVAPGAYFEAELLVNDHSEAVAVNAFYYGEECVLKKWRIESGKLFLSLFSAVSERSFTYQVNRDARLPSGQSWLQKDQVIYVLYNSEGEIRAAFLPD